jgi:N6-adenosine-specific RNA methylase IME4
VADLFGRTSIEYACLSMDPPWAEHGGGKIKRGADRHYDLAGKLGDIRPIVRAIRDSGSFTPAPNSHLWCWYTDNFLEDALALVRELGFRYVRTFQWIKVGSEEEAELADRLLDGTLSPEEADQARAELDEGLRMGIGQYGRGCHEGMIFAVRGKGQDPSVWTGDRGVRSCFHAPHPTDEHGKRIHSRKPPKSYELIERVSKGPRVEFFARIARPGWNVWGNQAPDHPDPG